MRIQIKNNLGWVSYLREPIFKYPKLALFLIICSRTFDVEANTFTFGNLYYRTEK